MENKNDVEDHLIIQEKKMSKAVLIDNEVAELVSKTVELSEARGEIMLSPESRRWVLRKKGNAKLIRATGLSTADAEYIWVNGKEENNPYVTMSAEGFCQMGQMRSTVYGYTPDGQMQGVTCSVVYLAEMVRRNMLQNMVRDYPASGYYAPDEHYFPLQYTGRDDKVYKTLGAEHMWKYFPIDEKLGGVFVDMLHPAVFDLMSRLTRELTYIASTLKRRILAKACQEHDAIKMSEINPDFIEHVKSEEGNDTIARIPMHVCKRSLSEERLRELQEAISKGMSYIPSDVKIISFTETIEGEDIDVYDVEEEDGREIEKGILLETIYDNPSKYFEAIGMILAEKGKTHVSELDIEVIKKIIGGEKDGTT